MKESQVFITEFFEELGDDPTFANLKAYIESQGIEVDDDEYLTSEVDQYIGGWIYDLADEFFDIIAEYGFIEHDNDIYDVLANRLLSDTYQLIEAFEHFNGNYDVFDLFNEYYDDYQEAFERSGSTFLDKAQEAIRKVVNEYLPLETETQVEFLLSDLAKLDINDYCNSKNQWSFESDEAEDGNVSYRIETLLSRETFVYIDINDMNVSVNIE